MFTLRRAFKQSFVVLRGSKEFIPRTKNLGSGNSPYLIPIAGKPNYDKFETSTLNDGSLIAIHKFEKGQPLGERITINKPSNTDLKRQKKLYDEIQFESKEQRDIYMRSGNLNQQQLTEFKTLREGGMSQRFLAKKFNLPLLTVANIISKNNFRKLTTKNLTNTIKQ